MEVKKPKNVKSQKTDEPVLAIFGKTVGHKGLKFGTGSFLTRIYNFFIKIFVGGRLDNNTKMLTNKTKKTNKKNVLKHS